jgi:hypothetical protein
MQITVEMVLKLLPRVSAVGPYATSKISQDLNIHRNYVFAVMLTDNVGIVVPSSAVTNIEDQDGSPLSLLIRWVQWALTLVVNRLERESESSPPYSVFLIYLAVVYLCLHWQNACLATYFVIQL